MFVDVVVSLPVDGEFTYIVPDEFAPDVEIGKRVLVPFGKRTVTGYIVNIKHKALIKNIKPVIDLLDTTPLFDSRRLKFFRWLSSYYFSTLGEALSLIHPKFVNIKSERVLALTPLGLEAIEKGEGKDGANILDILKTVKGGVKLSALLKRFKGKGPFGLVNKLKKDGLIVEEIKLKGGARGRTEKFYRVGVGVEIKKALVVLKRAPVQAKLLELIYIERELSLKRLRDEAGGAAHALSALVEKGFLEEFLKDAVVDALKDISPLNKGAQPEPNKDQVKALKPVNNALKKGGFNPFLLYGVTGSGKTLVYLKAIEEATSLGHGAIVLVPEIALTPRACAYLTERFQGKVALMHSGLNESERFYQWQRILSGAARVVIGTRSALFSPVKDLGIIIVDEEHETSYKQEEGVKYSARDSALMLAKCLGITVLLGSATPSVESFHNARTGKLKLLKMTKRVMDKPMPQIELEDMRGRRRDELFSERLIELIGATLARGEQTLIFLNRRGFSNFLICNDCGHAFECPNCSVTYTYHKGINRLRCHYCDMAVPLPQSCPGCDGNRFDNPGFGTEKVEEELRAIFPDARISRMDRDTTRRRGVAASILDAMDSGEIDILVGTQMVSKGHDFPGITLVGVISGDTSLLIPDFRGAERTFQLIAQAAGRAGRGDKEARVLVQTLNPDHFCFLSSKEHDYDAFFAAEIEERHDVQYPPFTRLCALRLDSTSEVRVETSARKIKTAAGRIMKDKKYSSITLLGPAPALVAKVRGRYRWHFLVKAKGPSQLVGFVRELRRSFVASNIAGVRLLIDMDPLTTV